MAPQQRRPRHRRPRTRRLALVAAGVVASFALASVPVHAVGARVAGRATDPPAPPVPAAPVKPPVPAAPVKPPVPAAPVKPPVPAAPVKPSVPAAPAAVTPAPVAKTPAPVVPTAPAAPSASVPPPAGSPVPATPSATPKPPEQLPAIGAYLHYGPRGVARIAELSNWLGGSDLRVAHTYLPGDRWSNIEGLPGFLDSWAEWRRDEDDRMFVLNVPMMERNEEGVSDHEVRALLRRAAAGQFDHHYRRLAERLVELKIPDTVIVLGWEMNGITYTHRCGPDPESWKKYWNRIVTTMRAVPGQKFKFDWTPNRGRDAIPWTQCYPGDDTVDIIGMDSYDQPRGITFDEQVKEPYGLQAHVDFAKAHKKPISYAEWGLFRNGDNPEYMRRMLAWMDEHKPLYNTLTDYCPHGVWQCSSNPKAAQVYRSMLFGRDTAGTATPTPTPTPTPKPAPTTPVRPPNCSPLELGDWVEYWLGGKLCVRTDWWSRYR
ncbi:glycoside hydrolase family 26 protein [Streptomyces stelliscabiei]|uniref:glycoside hydrolase family 26 protein n=1 Tax=Streptomyces stelliscabiei TaxID=146820 RepID=UPI0029B124D5|nr:glycosyl hydrolase [Streptomyces stelliscabiei]MDX2549936.1 glycosyl hydrolase [Streptomyces stelliscabiei]MDX2610644.1 glycosyl hydrolase [Streptomyces stelliscabiei]MDX2635267.1 glycosyl hydrolase [Streptomyces stelliscabiei]MDX2660830.1 glycosyl hydrolase [Streptomyces stelliscabiei]MDX2710406.1 glycosyl hydrolase [Streptomyces stelliscabiei]